MSRRDEIRRIVARALVEAGDDLPFADDESLVTSGRLSSLDVVSVLTSLEETFDFEISADDFDPLQFDTVESIAGLLGS